MKRLIFCLLLSANCFLLTAQSSAEVRATVKEHSQIVTELQATNEALSTKLAAIEEQLQETDKLPDTLFFNFDGKIVAVATKDFKETARQGGDVLNEIRNKAGEEKPEGPLQWILLIASVLITAPGITFLTNAAKVGKRVWMFVKGFKTAPENLVIFLSAVGGAGLAFLLGMGKWDTDTFMKTMPWLFMVATFIYLKTRKKSDDPQPATGN